MAKQAGGIRKQFLIVGDEVILAFVQKGKKFADCESFTEVSGDVSCKVSSICKIIISIYLMIMKELSGLFSVDLSVKAKGT